MPAALQSGPALAVLTHRLKQLEAEREDVPEKVWGRIEKVITEKADAMAALLVSVQLDEPLPQRFFFAWANRTTIYRWRRETGKPAAQLVAGELMIRPSEFFAALDSYSVPAPRPDPTPTPNPPPGRAPS